MPLSRMQPVIENAWEQRESLRPGQAPETEAAVEAVLQALDNGSVRIAEKTSNGWHVNQWLKKAVLLSFRLHPNQLIEGGPQDTLWWDKVPSKFAFMSAEDFAKAGYRSVPGSIVRRSAHIARGVVLMPCFVNVGAYIDENTMIDSWVTVGSCAQIGKNCHISSGAMIGGVLEPLQAEPVIIEDNCFIGALSGVAEGMMIGEGAVIGMGVHLNAATKIVDRASGEISFGKVPPYCVVVPGSLPDERGGPSLYCAVIVKRVDEKTRAKTSINDLLRA